MTTLTPGTRIRDWQTGRTGTVVEDAKTAEYHGFIPIHWDNGDRTLAHPSVLKATGGKA